MLSINPSLFGVENHFGSTIMRFMGKKQWLPNNKYLGKIRIIIYLVQERRRVNQIDQIPMNAYFQTEMDSTDNI